jgi:hypothetical protein
MQLYQGMSNQFIQLVKENRVEYLLESSFRRQMGYTPAPSEVRSWRNSLREVAHTLDGTGLRDVGTIVEFRLPQTSRRLDVMLMGEDHVGNDNAVIIELKQWDTARATDIEDTVEVGRVFHLHPSRQAGNYAQYLKDCHTAFYLSPENPRPIDLYACSFLHNARHEVVSELFFPQYSDTLAEYPLFTGDMRADLDRFLLEHLSGGKGDQLLGKVLKSRYRPSKKLLENTARIIQGNPVFTLLDEQQLVFNVVVSQVKQLRNTSDKAVVIITGGPGTGKSVIAVHLLAALAAQNISVVHCTGSKAFTTNLRAQVGTRSSALFKYFNSFSDVGYNEIDVLIADEAHRIRETSNSWFTPKSKRSNKSQIEELIHAAQLSVFLLDDNQVVRPDEIGTPALIEQTARRLGIPVWKFNLNAQFRCAGSDAYIGWLDYMMGLGGRNDTSWFTENDYEFKIVSSPAELEQMILARTAEGNTARLVAGFCWPWSDPVRDGSLVPDVVIGEWARPWNRKRAGNTTPKNDPYTIWATKEDGLHQVGCIYSAQGFEFDYCGVIFGNDLVWDETSSTWQGIKSNNKDRVVKRADDFTRLVLHTYRVLLSRGMKGTYVYFLDDATRRHFEEALTQ